MVDDSVGGAGTFVLTGPISTERLALRAYRSEDLAALHEIRSDPGTTRWLTWELQSETQVRQTIAERSAWTSLRGEGDALALLAERRETGEVVADVNLRWRSGEHATAEIGYIVHPAHAGNGYATEATRLLLAIAFGELGLYRVIARLEPRNVASARVLEKLGMRLEAHLVENEWVKGEWQSELVYAMLDREWRELQSAG